MKTFSKGNNVVVWRNPIHYKSNSGLFGSVDEVIPVISGDTLYGIITENKQKFLVTASYLSLDN